MSERILVVEDDEFMRESLETELLVAGYDVTVACNGAEAIALARESYFDLVVCDIRMPGMGGLETISNLKQHLPVARTIVMTGYASPETPVQAVKMQVDDYLMKPFSSEQFLASVRQALERYITELRKNKAVARWRSTLVELIESVRSRQPSERVTQAALRLCHRLRFALLRTRSVQLASWFLEADPGLLEPTEELRELAVFVTCARERWDGTGPQGLRAEQIPLESRILAAALAYDTGGELDASGLDPSLVELLKESTDGEVAASEEAGPAESLLSLAESYLQAGHHELAEGALVSLASSPNLGAEAELRYRRALLDCKVARGAGDAVETASELVAFCRSRGFDLAGANATLTWVALSLAEGKVDTSLLGPLEQARQTFALWEAPRELTTASLYAVALGGPLEPLLEILTRLKAFSALDLEVAVRVFARALAAPGGTERVSEALAPGGASAVTLLRRIADTDDLPLRLRVLDVLSAMPDKEARELLAQIGSQGGGVVAAKTGLLLARSESDVQLQVYLLGRFRFFRDGQSVAEEEFATRKVRSLFTYFCAHRDEVLEEDKLADVFWPHSPKAGHSLQNGVSQIRKLLTSLLGPSAREMLVKRRMGYVLARNPAIWVDVEEFQAACKRGLALVHSRSWTEAVAELKKAEPLYGGDLLEGLHEDWTEGLRVTLAGQRQSLLLALGYYFFERKKYEVSLDYWRKILKTDACCEEAYLGVMLCSVALERTGEAVKAYHSCAQKMREELHLSPSPRLVELYLKITGGGPIELVMQPLV